MKNRIKECRLHAGMTRDELGMKAGVSADAIRKWEVGERGISVAHVEQLATALDVIPAYLVSWSDKPQCQVIERTQLQQRLSRNAELRKRYAGGVIFVLKDGTKLYDNAKVNGLGSDATGNFIIGKTHLVPVSQVAYVERIEDDELNQSEAE